MVPALVQARLGSSRLPGKVLLDLGGRTVLERVLERCYAFTERAIVVTSDDPSDDALAQFLSSRGVEFQRGPLLDVYGRFEQAIRKLGLTTCDWFFRVTADCPLLAPTLGQQLLAARGPSFDVLYFDDASLPRGVAPELVRTQAFLSLSNQRLSGAEREHVTLGLYQRAASRAASLAIPPAFARPELRLTLDYPEDYELLTRLFDGGRSPATEDAISRLEREPSLAALNQHCQTAVPS